MLSSEGDEQFVAARIAEELTSVSSFKNEDPLDALLQVLLRELPIKFATIWKIKNNSGHICARAGLPSVYDPDPRNSGETYEFVCPIENSFISQIIAKPSFLEGNEFIVQDILQLKDDPFFELRGAAKYIGIKNCITIPIKTFQNGKISKLSFFLVIYTDEDFDTHKTMRTLLRAVSNKVATTLTSQIEIKMNYITNHFTTLSTAGLTGQIKNTIDSMVLHLLPEVLSYKSAIVFWRTAASQEYKIVSGTPDTVNVVSITKSEIETLSQLPYVDNIRTTILHRDKLQDCGIQFFKKASSVIICPVNTRLNSEKPIGFVVLVTKLNPLALRKNNKSEIEDFFDWEDELYLKHISSMLSFISELVYTEERRKYLVDQLAHETFMPATYIYNTMEEFLDDFDDHRKLPKLQRRARLRNVFSFASFQLALCEGILLGLKEGEAAPSEKYHPDFTNLTDLARSVAKLTFPLCQKHRVKNDNITISRLLPKLFVDRTVITQVILNLITNAIKYKGRLDYENFRVAIECEFENLSSVPQAIREIHGLVPGKAFASADDRRFSKGYLITVTDHGIGIAKGYEERIFERHFRVPGIEVWEARGSGLGLAIVRRLLIEHYSAIWVDSRDTPTTFAIYIPQILTSSEYTQLPSWNGRDRNAHFVDR